MTHPPPPPPPPCVSGGFAGFRRFAVPPMQEEFCAFSQMSLPRRLEQNLQLQGASSTCFFPGLGCPVSKKGVGFRV